MTLKAIISTDDYEAMDSAIGELYTENGDHFILDVEGAEDLPAVRGLKKNSKAIRGEKSKLQELLVEMEAKIEGYQSKDTQAKEDQAEFKDLYEGLKESAGTKEAGLLDQISILSKARDAGIIKEAVAKIALELGGQERMAAWTPHIASRLSVGEDSSITITDSKGRASDLGVDDFVEELRAMPELNCMLKITQSSGSGAGGVKGSGSGGTNDSQRYFDRGGPDYNMGKMAELFKADPSAARIMQAKGLQYKKAT